MGIRTHGHTSISFLLAGSIHSEPEKRSELSTVSEVTKTLGSTVCYPAVHPKVYPGQADVNSTETSPSFPIIQSQVSYVVDFLASLQKLSLGFEIWSKLNMLYI